MRIGADKRIGERVRLAVRCGVKHDAREVFEVHLVANAGIGRNDLEIVQGFLSPAQEGVALDVALEFEFRVEREGHVGAELVHLHRVVDHQFGGQQGIHFFRIAAQRADRFAHGGEIDDGGHAGKILQEHARGHEGNFLLRRGVRIPTGQRLDICGMNESPVLLAQKIFEQHAQREGKLGDMAHSLFLQRAQSENFVGLAVHLKRVARAE